MTEEETFRILRRRSFEEAKEAWDKCLREGFSVQRAIEDLNKIGWKKEEFYDECSTRGGWK